MEPAKASSSKTNTDDCLEAPVKPSATKSESSSSSNLSVVTVTVQDRLSEIKESTPTTTTNVIPRLKRRGITFLSGDPMKIGLIGKKGGLSTVVRALQQKKLETKIGTLEKSRMDWQTFKKKEGIEEELHSSVKSKNGYLERQEFLQRTDLREFEIEKDLRAKKRRLTNPEN